MHISIGVFFFLVEFPYNHIGHLWNDNNTQRVPVYKPI